MDDKSTSEVKFVNKSTHKLGFFGFFAITASMVMTVYEYPSFATSGFQLVFFLIIGGILWFLPVALCSAEMATVEGWESGGIYSWGWKYTRTALEIFSTVFSMVSNNGRIRDYGIFYTRRLGICV